MSGYKSALVQAALSLGSPEILQALRNNPDYAEYAGVIDQGMVNPESTMAQLQKQEEGGLKEVDVGRNANNTFFSGFRLQDRGKVTDEYNSRRTGAVNEYVSGAQADATRGLAGALNDYNRAMNEALGYDIEDQLAAEPEPEAAPEPVPTAATHGAPPKGVDRSRSQAAAARARAEAAAREAEQRARARARLRGRR